MSGDQVNVRWERIKRMLDELRYEIERGMMEREIDEHLGYRFYVPISQKIPDGVVFCEFRTRPIPRGYMNPDDLTPRLKLVKS
jgi:hypothetical protein